MTDTLLALIPTYGVWLIFVSVTLSCLALPIPSSMLVMAAGGFAAGGDLVFWQVLAAAFAGFVIGDQMAYGIARKGGRVLITKFRNRPKTASVFNKAEHMLERRGPIAVFLSRTIFSPLGPYLGYLSGAMKLRWSAFTLAAILGAACWSAAYGTLGYAFANQITQIASLIGNSVGIVMAIAVIVGILWYMRRSWKNAQDLHKAES